MNKFMHYILISFLLFASVGIAEAATAVTVNLNDSDGDPITTGATLKYYDGGWQTAIDNNDGTFTANVNGSNIMYRMTYNLRSQTITTTDNPVNFSTVATTAVVKDSDGNTLAGGTFTYYGSNWSSSFNAGTEIELLPGNYSVSMRYNNSSEQKNGQTVSGTSTEIEFTTVTVTPRLLNCDEEDVDDATFVYYGNNAWTSSQASNTSVEMLPGSYAFAMSINGTREQQNGVAILGTNTQQDVPFYATQINYIYGGNITYYSNGWRSYTQGMYLMAGNYVFKFGNERFDDFAVSGCSMDGNVNIFRTKKADGSALPDINIRRNTYGNNYTNVGTTDANGLLFSTDQPNGSWKYRAHKDNTNQYIISGPNNITFQTSKYTAHVTKQDGSDFEGIETEYNTYGNNWIDLSPRFTDASGEASIELFAGDYNFRAKKDNTTQVLSHELTAPGTSGTVEFQTSKYTAHVTKHDGSDFEGIETEYNTYGNNWIDLSPRFTDASGEASIELFAGDYNFRAKKDNTTQVLSHELTTPGTSGTVEFQTALALAYVNDCDLDAGVEGIEVEYNTYGNNWIDLSPRFTGADGLASIELFPGTYNLRAKTLNTYETKSITLVGSSTQVEFNPTRLDYNFTGAIKYNTYGNNWITISPGTYLFPGTYKFKFGDFSDDNFVVSGCSMEGNVNIFKTLAHDGTPLPNIPIERNHYYSSYTPVGTTDANGILFTTDQPDGSWKYKATKDRSVQYIISGPNNITFQTSEFVTHVMHTDGSPFEGIETDYNHYYSSYMDVGTTDANGNASIELFPGDYKFKATKDRSIQYKNLEILTPGTSATVDFQTSTFVTHVMDHDGNPFEGIKTEYNHYYSSYMGLSPSTTDASGNASIELFPGKYQFKATKHNSFQTQMCNIPTSGTTTSFDFQTALAEAHVKDCDLNTGVEGVAVEYNHYYSSYMDLNPNTTSTSGLASIELFPGTYKFKATIHNSSEVQTVAITGPVTTFEFNPTRVTFNYPGTVKYNHYYSSYMTIGDNTYLFPGTYNFRFYTGNNLDLQIPIEIAGCSVDQSLIFVQLQNSQNAGLANGDFKYRIGWGGYTGLGTDATGNGMWTFIDGHPTNTKVTVTYEGASVEKQQNITTNPMFIFNTVDVTADLRNSSGNLLTADSWEYRYGWGSYNTLNASGHELLPVNTKVRVGYMGTKIEKQQNVGSNSHFDFATINVTADLKDSQNGSLTADSWEYRYGWGSYSPMNNLGEELLPVNVKVRVGYKGSKVEKQQNVGSNSHYDFNTVNVTAELKSSTGGSLTADDWKYRYGWGSYSSLANGGEELLPVNVKVKVYYNGACVEKQQNVGSSPHYVFNTVNVTAGLEDSNGDPLTADDFKYRYGWGSYSALTNAGHELLPVNVKVKVYYKGACVEKQQNVGSNPDYNFNTVLVTADLKDGNGGTLNADAWDYRYGWGSYSTLDNAGEELLPVNVKVRATYNGVTKEKQQNVGSASSYLFTWNGVSLYKSTNDYDFTSEKVSVYPNPSNGKFMIENVANYFRLSVYDMTGRVVYQSDINEVNNQNIILDNPVPGAYMIQLEGVGSTVTTPIMIK